MTRIYDKKTRDIMIAVMHKRTKIGCARCYQQMSHSHYSKLYQEKLCEKYTAVGIVGALIFTSALASFFYEFIRILSQRIEEINVFVTWLNWYIPLLIL